MCVCVLFVGLYNNNNRGIEKLLICCMSLMLFIHNCNLYICVQEFENLLFNVLLCKYNYQCHNETFELRKLIMIN